MYRVLSHETLHPKCGKKDQELFSIINRLNEMVSIKHISVDTF